MTSNTLSATTLNDPSHLATLAASANAQPLTIGTAGSGEATKPGRYLFVLAKSSILSIELIGGGGGGGGTTAGDQTKRGAGGKAALETHVDLGAKFGPGTHLLIVGEGGTGGSGGEWSAQPVDGEDGTPTTISRWPDEFPICAGKPGAGGKGDGVPMVHQGNDDYAGSGENLTDPVTGAIYHGGAGGGWQQPGAHGGGYGSGGGGQGGTTHPGQSRGGDGAGGYARLTLAEGNHA